MLRHVLRPRVRWPRSHRLAPLVAFACGCLPSVPESRREVDASTPAVSADAGAPSVRIELAAFDARGDAWPLDALPRRVAFDLRGASSPEDRPALFLFEGAPDAALVEDLARWPVLVANQARQVSIAIRITELGASIVPEAPLALGGRYTLAVAAWARDARGEASAEPRLFDLRVAMAEAGAVVVETWPAAGTYGVPPTIPFLVVRFDDLVEGIDAVRVATAGGATIPSAASRRACGELALGPGECVVLVPRTALPEQTDLGIEIGTGAIDRTGAPVGPFEADFRTGSTTDAYPSPGLEPLSCDLDESPLEGGCALRFDSYVRVRARASAPARVRLVAGGATYGASAPRGDFRFTVERLAPGVPLPASLTLFGLDGAEAWVEWSLETAADLAPVFITEVRADPDGPEPDQEYVELHNASDAPIDLLGFRITDDSMRTGDILAAPAVLPARGYALVVGAGFDPDGAADDPVPPGIPLFRVDASIGGGGLANEGEPVYLRDAAGRRVSAAPAMAAPSSGVCIVRAATDGRTGDPSSFVAHPEGRCGPGRADPVEGL